MTELNRTEWGRKGNNCIDIPEILNKSISLSIWFLYWQDRNVTRVSAGYEKALGYKALDHRFEAFLCSVCVCVSHLVVSESL